MGEEGSLCYSEYDLKALRIAVEERMKDADTAPGIRSIGTDGVPADHQFGGVVYSIAD